MELRISISGMSCGHCVAAVRKALESVNGAVVSEISVGRARLTVPEGTDMNAIHDAISRAGYKAESVSGNSR